MSTREEVMRQFPLHVSPVVTVVSWATYSGMVDEIATLRAERDALRKEADDANGLLRSVHHIAQREGKDTNWAAFGAQVDEFLLDQHQRMYPDADREASP